MRNPELDNIGNQGPDNTMYRLPQENKILESGEQDPLVEQRQEDILRKKKIQRNKLVQ